MRCSTALGALLASLLPFHLAACDATPSFDAILQLVRGALDRDATDLLISRCSVEKEVPGMRCEVLWHNPRYGEMVVMSLWLLQSTGNWRIAESHPIL